MLKIMYIYINIFIIFSIFNCCICSQLLGGFKKINTNDAGFKDISNYVLKKFQENHPSMLITLVDVKNAESQVVAGINYRATFIFGFNNCGRESEIDICEVTSTQECNIEVFSVPWLNTQQITKMDCKDLESVSSNRSKRSVLLENFSEKGKKDDDNKLELQNNQELIEFVLHYLNLKSGGYYSINAEKLHFISKEFLQDILIELFLEINVKSCKKLLLNECFGQQYDFEKLNCTLKIKHETDAYSLISYNCSKSLTHNRSDKIFFSQSSFEEDMNILSISKLQRYSSEEAFNLFKKTYDRIYFDDEEETKRFEIFKKNMDKAKFIQNHDIGTAVYGATEFADLSEEEFRTTHLSPKWNKNKHSKNLIQAKIPKISLPNEFDWREHNAVTEVKNQGFCGSCWAFSVTGNIEGQYAIKKGILYSLSEQELVDCDKLDEGCNGGLPSLAYEEIQILGGLETEDDYPYKGKDMKCSFDQKLVQVKVNGSLNISSNEADMQAWMVENGPMSIGINAFAMQFYFFGISHPWHLTCPPDLDHGVLIVGYGTKKGWLHNIPYWIVKNSWGKSWGQKGYYLVYRGDGTCGLNEMVTSAYVV